MTASEHLLLDPAIRDWVVIPMFIMLILVGIARQYLMTYTKSDPKFSKADLAEQALKNVLMRSSCIRMNGKYIPEKAFNMRKRFMIQKKTGKFDGVYLYHSIFGLRMIKMIR